MLATYEAPELVRYGNVAALTSSVKCSAPMTDTHYGGGTITVDGEHATDTTVNPPLMWIGDTTGTLYPGDSCAVPTTDVNGNPLGL